MCYTKIRCRQRENLLESSALSFSLSCAHSLRTSAVLESNCYLASSAVCKRRVGPLISSRSHARPLNTLRARGHERGDRW